ncbi:hypothetical protein [Roseisolibacter sp. H3M3-2]|uniref:hypothetical protein n=1 Tax=Roseisolibacter sp. H3M3-2 TaxID=3031323 RepID=UPI0023DB2014|nr:hypothetical protein [Roseisolibacter sp. H3M3-2]MDF1501830.1 hypothetical protein [Roseisolibacter sp. H3M3-2]
MEILVATSADFARLSGGRPVASGAWDDVVQARALTAASGFGVGLALRLRGGGEFVARDDAPGWDEFLDAAESALPGMQPRDGWQRVLAEAAGGPSAVVFERGAHGS